MGLRKVVWILPATYLGYSLLAFNAAITQGGLQWIGVFILGLPWSYVATMSSDIRLANLGLVLAHLLNLHVLTTLALWFSHDRHLAWITPPALSRRLMRQWPGTPTSLR